MVSRIFRKEIWSIVIATLVTALIWVWAARETQDSRQVVVQVEFIPRNPAEWYVATDTNAVTVTLQGSRQALRDFAVTSFEPFRFAPGLDGVPGGVGTHPIDMAARLSQHERLADFGLSIEECEPASIQLTIDRIVSVEAEVRPDLPGARLEGERIVSPSTVTLYLPQEIRKSFPEKITLVAGAEPWRIDQLASGQEHTLDIRVAIPETLLGQPNVRIEPPSVSVTFSIRSQVRLATLDNVRVQLAGPWEDGEDYKVEIEPTLLRQVTIRADAELVRRITAESLPVIAFVHVSSRQKEQGITSAPISFLQAQVPNADGSIDHYPVSIELGPGESMPVVNLTITERPVEEAGQPSEQTG